MQFTCIFGMIFLCTLYNSVKSTTEKDNDLMTQQPTDDASNTFIGNGPETDALKVMLIGKKNKPETDALKVMLRGKKNKPETDDLKVMLGRKKNKPETDALKAMLRGKNNKPETDALKAMLRGGKNPETDDLKVMLRRKKNKPETDALKAMLRGKKNKAPGLIRNCLDLKKKGKPSGTYTINPCDDIPSKVADVYCDMDTDGGGWTVIQRRDNFPHQENFYKTWLEYSIGFGDVSRDFWLGNKNIHCLTEQNYNEIRFDLVDWTDSARYAKYGFFYVYDEAANFKLVVQDYSGNASDSFSPLHNGMKFSTFDADNDLAGGSCSKSYTGAWWYNVCHHSNLNGQYNSTAHASGITWYKWKGHNYSLKKTEMKIRPKKY